MTLEARALALAEIVGTDIGNFIKLSGQLTALTTTNKTSLVNAIDELKSDLDALLILQAENNAIIDDNVGVGFIDKGWSVNKIISAMDALKTQIIDGAPETYNTLSEISTYLVANTNSINEILVAISNRVRYDATQSLIPSQQLQSCTNIGIGDNIVDIENAYLVASDVNTYIQPGFVRPGYVA